MEYTTSNKKHKKNITLKSIHKRYALLHLLAYISALKKIFWGFKAAKDFARLTIRD